MKPKGTIFRSGKSPVRGEVFIAMSIGMRLIYAFLRSTGAGLFAFAIISVLFAFGPIIQQEMDYQIHRSDSKKEQVVHETLVNITKAEETVKIQQEAESYGVNSYFSVVIPEIDATSNVIANVDATQKDEYLNALKMGVAHAKGTYFPGQGKRVLLFSHSTDSPLNIARYNAVFYLLRKLEAGDKIIVYFADRKYVYEVESKIITPPSDTSWLTDKGNDETLLLMTCDPPGTTWNRLIIKAKPTLSG